MSGPFFNNPDDDIAKTIVPAVILMIAIVMITTVSVGLGCWCYQRKKRKRTSDSTDLPEKEGIVVLSDEKFANNDGLGVKVSLSDYNVKVICSR